MDKVPFCYIELALPTLPSFEACLILLISKSVHLLFCLFCFNLTLFRCFCLFDNCLFFNFLRPAQHIIQLIFLSLSFLIAINLLHNSPRDVIPTPLVSFYALKEFLRIFSYALIQHCNFVLNTIL